MILEAIGIYAAYKIADKYNKRKEKENDKIRYLESRIRLLELEKRIKN